MALYVNFFFIEIPCNFYAVKNMYIYFRTQVIDDEFSLWYVLILWHLFPIFLLAVSSNWGLGWLVGVFLFTIVVHLVFTPGNAPLVAVGYVESKSMQGNFICNFVNR